MQLRTLPECNRLYKQQLQEQEQISLEVLDQVQESLSLLRTLYRSRMFSMTTASNGDQAYAEAYTNRSTERLQLTETQKTDSELENQQQSATQLDPQDMLLRAHHLRKNQEKRVPHDALEVVEVPTQKNACRPDVASAERKTTVLQQPGFKRSSSKEHTLCTQQQRASSCGHLQPFSIKHGTRPHSGTEQVYVPTGSSRPTSIRNGDVTNPPNEDTLHTATHESPFISLHSPVAAVTDNGKIVCTAPQDAARAGSFFRLVKERSSPVPNGSNANISAEELRDERLATQTCTRRDVACTANLSVCVSVRGTSTPGYPRVSSPSPSSQLLLCKAIKCEEKWMSSQHPSLESTSVTTASQQSNCISDLLTQAPPSAIAHSSATSDKNTSECKSKWKLVAASVETTAENGYNFTPVGHDTKFSSDLHEDRYFSSCTVQSKPIRSGNSQQGDGKRTAAMTALGANHLDTRNVKSQEVQGGDRSPQNQRVDSAVQAQSPKKDSSNPFTEPSVTTCLPSDPVAVNEVINHRYNPHIAATSRAGKPLFHRETAAVDSGSRSNADCDSASLVAIETSEDYASQEIPCTEAQCEVATPRTVAVLTSPAYCCKHWNENNVQFCKSVGMKSTLRSPDTSLPTSGSNKTETEAEVAAVDFPLQSGPTHREGGGSEDRQTGSHSRCWKPDRGTGGHRLRTRGKEPLHQTPKRPSTIVAAGGVHYWEDPQPHGFSKALSRHVRSPSRKTVLPPPFHMSTLRKSLCNTEPHVPHSPHTEPPCAFLVHCPYKGYAIVRPDSVVGSGEEMTSLSASSRTPEKQRAASTCAAGDPAVSIATKGLLSQRSRNRRKKDVDNFCVFTAPSYSPSTPALSCSQKRLCALSVPSPPSLALHPTSPPANDVLATPFFKSCCYGSQQPAALLGKARRIRWCCRKLRSPSSLCNGRCLAAATASKSSKLPKKVSRLLSQKRGSESDDASIPRIHVNAASAGNCLVTGVVGKEVREPVTMVSAASCENAASSRAPACSLLLLSPVCANGEPESPDTSPGAYSKPLFYAASSHPLLVSASHDTTNIAPPSACRSRTPVPLSRSLGRPATPEASHAAYCILCCHPLDCNALTETVAQPFLHAGETAHRFCAPESAPQTACICPVQEQPQEGIRSDFRSEGEWGKSRPFKRSEIHLCCGAQRAVPKRELQMPLTFEASAYNFQGPYHEHLRAPSFAGCPSETNKLTAAAQSRAQLKRWGSNNTCATPTKQKQTANIKVECNSKTPEEARLQDRLGTRRRRCPSAFAQPAWSVTFQPHRLRRAPLSNADTGACQVPGSKMGEASSHGACTRSATIPFGFRASHSDAEQCRVPRQQPPAISRRINPLCLPKLNQEQRRQPSKPNMNQVSSHQQHECQHFQQEQSQPLFPLVHYGSSQHLHKDSKMKSGSYWDPDEFSLWKGTEDVYEESRGHTFSQKMRSRVSAPRCGFTCCSAVQQNTGSQQQASPLGDTSEARAGLSFSVRSGRVRTQVSGFTSHCSSMRDLSTASTQAEDAASPEFSLRPSVETYRNKICMTHPQKDKNKRQSSVGSRDADLYGSSTLDDTFRQRKAIVTGKHPEQLNLQREAYDTSARVVGKPTLFPHVAAQRRFALVSHHRCESARPFTRSSSACLPNVTNSHEELDGLISREISNEYCQWVVAETPGGATQIENPVKKHQRCYLAEKSHETGDCSSNSHSHQMRKMLLRSHAEKHPHPAKKLMPMQVPEAKTACCTNESNSPEDRSYHQLPVLGHQECASGAVAEATEPAASLQQSSFIVRVATAEAAAILRSEG